MRSPNLLNFSGIAWQRLDQPQPPQEPKRRPRGRKDTQEQGVPHGVPYEFPHLPLEWCTVRGWVEADGRDQILVSGAPEASLALRLVALYEVFARAKLAKAGRRLSRGPYPAVVWCVGLLSVCFRNLSNSRDGGSPYISGGRNGSPEAKK